MATTHTVKQGECMASIAKKHKFADYRTIYDHGKNARLRTKRPNPNMLFPGDRVHVPDREEKDESRGTTETHTFEVPTYQVKLRLAILDRVRTPYAGKQYELHLKGGQTLKGTTSDKGLIEETIPADVESATLWIKLDDDRLAGLQEFECRLAIGHLDPVVTAEGVQARLNNLAFPCGAVDGMIGPLTAAALKGFQMAESIKESGRADSGTQNELRKLHDFA